MPLTNRFSFYDEQYETLINLGLCRDKAILFANSPQTERRRRTTRFMKEADNLKERIKKSYKRSRDKYKF